MLTHDEALTRTFYDGDQGATAIYTGKIWKSETKILGTADDWLSTRFIYDDYGRVQRTEANNHLNLANLTSEAIDMTYDYADNILTQQRAHSAFGATQNIHERWTYDHQGRNTEHWLQLNGGTDVQLCTQDYTVKDELKTKYLGGNAAAYLQKNDYDYLPNGFLSKINHGSGYEADDLFQLELRYDQGVELGAAQYNGNIAQLIWQVPGSDAQTYGFTYDYLDRLTTSTYGAYPGGILSVTDSYNSAYTYDLNGNLQTDPYKQLSITYNYLNLPENVSQTGGGLG